MSASRQKRVLAISTGMTKKLSHTRERVVPGAIVNCEPVGLLEQREGEEVDHKFLAALPGQEVSVSPALLQELQDFIYAVFADFPEVHVRVGPLRPREADIPAGAKEQGCQEAFDAGANACFGRVFDITDLLRLIKTLIDTPMAMHLVDR